MTVSIALVVYVLTSLSSLLVLFTRHRLRASQVRSTRSNRASASGLVTAYTTTGLLGVLGWVLFLFFPDDSLMGHPLVGVVGLFFLWITALLGLRFVTKRRPRGRHAAPTEAKTTSGHGLLLGAQLAIVLSVSYFTWAYTTAAV